MVGYSVMPVTFYLTSPRNSERLIESESATIKMNNLNQSDKDGIEQVRGELEYAFKSIWKVTKVTCVTDHEFLLT